MAENQTCRRCGARLADSAPGRYCPSCLIREGLGEEQGAGSREPEAEDGVLHKLVWNKITPSDRQLGDAAGVVAVQAGKLDVPYLQRWGEALGVAAELGRLLRGEIKPKRT